MKPLRAALMGNYSTYPFADQLEVRREAIRRVTSWNETLAAGLASEEIVRSYPALSREAVQAAIAYAAELAHERVVQI